MAWKMKIENKSLIYSHISVFLFGFSALFARFITQPAAVITFGRVFFSSVFLFLAIKIQKRNLRLKSRGDYLVTVFSGVLLAIHWFCFIHSIQISSVAIGTITFSAFPVFTSFLEPLFFKEKIRIRTIICSSIMIAGVFFITPVFGWQEDTGEKLPGIIFGLISGLTYAVFSLFFYAPDCPNVCANVVI
jgi:RarD protein